MRTTITIDQGMLEELVEATGEKSKSAALNRAAEEYLRREKLRRLKDVWLGTQVDDVRREAREADLRELEALDLRAMEQVAGDIRERGV